MGGRPLQFQEQPSLHPSCFGAAQDGFDRRVDRLDDAEARRMVTVRPNALDVLEKKGAESFYLRQALPAEPPDLSEQKIENARLRLVGS
jgi:hypothetical protein